MVAGIDTLRLDAAFNSIGVGAAAAGGGGGAGAADAGAGAGVGAGNGAAACFCGAGLLGATFFSGMIVTSVWFEEGAVSVGRLAADSRRRVGCTDSSGLGSCVTDSFGVSTGAACCEFRALVLGIDEVA